MYKIKNIKQAYYLDNYSIVVYLLVSFSFPTLYKAIIPLIIGITLFEIYRLYTRKISDEYFTTTYFYLLVFSLLFFRSVHTLILIINLCFHIYLFYKNKVNIDFKTLKSEWYILLFFGLIVLNFFIHILNLKGIETYLYLLLYPLLFFSLKSLYKTIQISKIINVFITSVMIATFYLLIINAFTNKISLSTNTFFSDYLGIIHVYFGMYVGLATSFLLGHTISQKFYISKNVNFLLLIFFISTLVYIGARIALLAVLLISIITIYKRIKGVWYIKIVAIAGIAIGLFVISYNTIPRAKRGLDSIEKIYTSVKTNDKVDLVQNSWRNMYKRYLVTTYTLHEIKHNYLLGIGIKNVKSIISSKIIDDGYIHFEPINSHNQYLHFLIGMGIPSFLFFIWILFYFYKNHSYSTYAFYFLLFFILIMLTESILVRIKGISLFYLFYLIFSLQKKK